MDKRLPLTGIRVLDFAQLAAGPAASKMLADFGAEVIQIESEAYFAKGGGGSRNTGPPGASSRNTGWFHNKFNTNKLSVTVNLSTPKGKDAFFRLARVSDIFLANRRPQVLQRLGLTYEAMRAVRPDIIYISMPMMSHEGPRRFYSSPSWGTQSLAGLNMISGFADRPPTSPSPYSHPDVSCNPLHGAFVVLAALRYRRRTGHGQFIELSQYQSSINWTGPALLQYTANGTLMERSENRRAGAAPHDVYRCLGDEAWCAISVFTDDQWRALCETIGRSELGTDPSYATVLERKDRESQLREIIETWTTQRTSDEVMETLQAAGVPCAGLNNMEQLLRRDPQLRARGLWREIEHPELHKVLFEGWGFGLSKTGSPRVGRAPLMGEHTEYVFHDIVGMSTQELEEHLAEGALA